MQQLRSLKRFFLLSVLFVSHHAYAVDAPAPVSDDTGIFWNKVAGANAINVHFGNGDFIESLPGDATRWFPFEGGDYFLVATDNGPWQGWGRSEIVTVSGFGLDGLNPNLFLNDLHSIVYSSTAAELFWQIDEGVSYAGVDILRSDDLGAFEFFFTNGRSFFDSSLQPGTTYYYELIPVDEAGNLGEFSFVELTTPGEQVVPADLLPPDEPPPIDVDYIPLPPENLRAEVYSTSAIELFWDHAADFAGNAIYYHVYQDGEDIGITSGASFFIEGLESGTSYDYTVEAVANALNSSEPATITVQTRGFPTSTTAFGKPSGNRDTHRFDLWDNMSAEQQAQWPSDCLFGIRGVNLFSVPSWITPNLCFSPGSRALIHRNVFNFPLPGDNDTNHVEAVEWLHAQNIGLVADISTAFPQTNYELSIFHQSGDFEGTFPILESVQWSDPQGNARRINLDGKNVKVTVSTFGRSNGFRVKELIVIAEYWEAIPGQSTQDLSGWNNEGAFVSWIEPFTGKELQTNYYAGRSAESITQDELIR